MKRADREREDRVLARPKITVFRAGRAARVGLERERATTTSTQKERRKCGVWRSVNQKEGEERELSSLTFNYFDHRNLPESEFTALEWVCRKAKSSGGTAAAVERASREEFLSYVTLVGIVEAKLLNENVYNSHGFFVC